MQSSKFQQCDTSAVHSDDHHDMPFLVSDRTRMADQCISCRRRFEKMVESRVVNLIPCGRTEAWRFHLNDVSLC